MMSEFIDFVTELFPSIRPYTKEQVKASIQQFDRSGVQRNFSMHSALPYLAQGDIFGDAIPFFKQDKDGNLSVLRTKAILLSNTCDSERDDVLIFAPLIPIKDLKLDEHAIKSNQIYRLLYFPDPIISNYVVDFSLLNSFSRQLFEEQLKQGNFKKTLSLNDLGYYLFLCKLTIHLMRPEDGEVQKTRSA